MIQITPRAWRMMMLAARHDDGLEVGGFFRFALDEAGTFTVDDVLVPPQVVTSVHTDIQDDQLDWFMCKLIERGEAPKNWGWFHSHATMSAFASGTDSSTLRELAVQAQTDYAVGIVVNVHGATHGWACFKNPFGTYTEQVLSVEVLEAPDPELEALMADMMKDVKGKTWTIPTKVIQNRALASVGQTTTSQAWINFEEKGIYGITDEDYEELFGDDYDRLASYGNDQEPEHYFDHPQQGL